MTTQQRIPHKWSLNMNQFIVIDGKNAPFENPFRTFFQNREVDASHSDVIIDHIRCIANFAWIP